MDLTDPTEAALLVAEAFERAHLPYALYGGLVLAAYGEPRETRDVDLAVVDVEAAQARRALLAAGVETELQFEQVRMGGLEVARVTLLGGEDDLGLNTLDLVRPRSARYAGEAVSRAVSSPLRGRQVRVLMPEDFIVFKLLSTRERDLEDAVSVFRRLGAALCESRVDEEVRRLAQEVPDAGVAARHHGFRRRLGS